MKPIPSFLVTTLARNDLSRISNQLYDLQRQTASGNIADDLKGYGNESGRIVNARTAISQSTARVDAANQLVTRIEIQDIALDKAASAAAQLKQEIFIALSSDNGSFLGEQLKIAFHQATEALNTSYAGTPLFSGERRDGVPVQANNLQDLPGAIGAATLFNESVRPQTVDLGVGAPVVVAEKVSDIAGGLYTVFRNLYDLTQTGLDSPLTTQQRQALESISFDMGVAYDDVLAAQGRNGDVQSRVERDTVRLTNHADLLSKHLAKVSEVDLAEVAMKLSAAQTQYQAIAKVFTQVKDLSLINFLD
jgi:flagellar hook-associated protein 3 FlgL